MNNSIPTREPDKYIDITENHRISVWFEKDHYVCILKLKGDKKIVYSDKELKEDELIISMFQSLLREFV